MSHKTQWWQRGWTAPKQGNRREQNEDAFRIAESDAGLLIAVADGASEAVYARGWAQALVRAAAPEWVTYDAETLNEWLDVLRAEFRPVAEGEVIPWYVRNKWLVEGSQATLLVCWLHRLDAVGEDESPSEEVYRLEIISVGDSSALILRADGSLEGFPYDTAEEYGTHPALVTSKKQETIAVQHDARILRCGDMLLVCSDAIGAWFLRFAEHSSPRKMGELLITSLMSQADVDEAETDDEPPTWRQRVLHWLQRAEGDKRAQLESAESALAQPTAEDVVRFEQMIEQLRQSDPPMRNDDTTLVICTIG